LIGYTSEARQHVRDLIAHYRKKLRPEAVRNLNIALARAEDAIARGTARSRAFPASYRDLAMPGRAWIKEGIYWIAFRQTVPPVIIAVFWEQAQIDQRFSGDAQ
jgi:hypothetical protein